MTYDRPATVWPPKPTAARPVDGDRVWIVRATVTTEAK